MDFILADAQTSEQIKGSVPVYFAGGIALGSGGFIFALSLSTRDDFNQTMSLLTALVSLAVMVYFMLAILNNDGRDTLAVLEKILFKREQIGDSDFKSKRHSPDVLE